MHGSWSEAADRIDCTSGLTKDLARSLLPTAAMATRDETTLWTRPQGIRCVLLPYDEARYQLKLVRDTGTIKADLFAGHANAVAAAGRWREEFDVPRDEWPPPELDRYNDCDTPDD